MNVAIADDSVLLRERIKALLNELDFVRIVGEAENTLAAKTLLETTEMDVFILDIRMPGGTGFDVLKIIKEKYPWIRTIILSNYDHEQYKERGQELGADFFINKINDFEQVADAVKSIAEQKASDE